VTSTAHRASPAGRAEQRFPRTGLHVHHQQSRRLEGAILVQAVAVGDPASIRAERGLIALSHAHGCLPNTRRVVHPVGPHEHQALRSGAASRQTSHMRRSAQRHRIPTSSSTSCPLRLVLQRIVRRAIHISIPRRYTGASKEFQAAVANTKIRAPIHPSGVTSGRSPYDQEVCMAGDRAS